jgi:hypothetical protein
MRAFNDNRSGNTSDRTVRTKRVSVRTNARADSSAPSRRPYALENADAAPAADA